MPEPSDSARSDAESPSGKHSEGAGNSTSAFGPVGKAVIDALPIGVVLLERDAKVAGLNACARALIDSDELNLAGNGDESDSILPDDLMAQLTDVINTGEGRVLDGFGVFKGAAERFRLCGWPVDDQVDSIGCILTIEDRSEVVEMQRQAADADRLAALGNLASKVAHELNNPLDGILRYVNLAMRAVEEQGLEKPCEYLGQCRRGLMRMAQIVSELLEFSRRTYASLETASVEKVIEEALRTLESRVEGQGVMVTRNYGQIPAQVRSRNLFQVFSNLVKNALDAMPEGGELTVSTSVACGMVAVEFRDTGGGFSSKDAEAIFEPFYTTKGEGKGTGLGLAICKDIVERQGGHIEAENAPAGGSVFTVRLPERSDVGSSL
jgi:signal transduction histidine kinase